MKNLCKALQNLSFCEIPIGCRPRTSSGRLFVGTNFRAFQEALARAKLKLPKGQLTHILRHTFASHYMINGGDLLKLNKILDHSTIEMTMRYAHLSPKHLEDAVERSVLSSLERG
ncbi:tyrosine-type recombinase/integrase [Microbulbifer sp. ANSA003]|uniref:tyrosine-type recombinase/integrase n=1 Tax=Microbulbifer sp. ANSA003 TaxID=3243360 RepID=UPI004042367E